MYRKVVILKSKAFTLVELLVVISIIAVLLAVLMPSLNKARESAKRTVCASQLKQMGTAASAYSNDNRYLLPYSHMIGKDGFWNYFVAFQGAASPSIPTVYNDTVNNVHWVNQGLLFYYKFCPSSKAFFCPSQQKSVMFNAETYFAGDKVLPEAERVAKLANTDTGSKTSIHSTYLIRAYDPRKLVSDRGGYTNDSKKLARKMMAGGNYAFIADRWNYGGNERVHGVYYNCLYSDGHVKTYRDSVRHSNGLLLKDMRSENYVLQAWELLDKN